MIEQKQLLEKIANAMESLSIHINSQFSKAVLNKIAAEDIVQETYAKAVVASEDFQFHGDVQLLAWLKKIATHFTISFIRRSKSNGQLLSENLIDSGIFTPSSCARKKEAIELIEEGMAGLDSIQQAIIRLRYEKGKSFVQIASELDLTDQVVRGRHRNGLVKLRKLASLKGILSSVKLVGSMKFDKE